MNSEMPIDPLSAAAAHAELGLPASSAARRLIQRMTRFFVEPQRAYNRGVVDAVRILRDQHRGLAELVGTHAEAHDRLSAGLRADIRELHNEVSDSQTTASLIRVQVAELARAVQRLEERMARVDAADPVRARADD
jgi:hypothetical protein